MKDIAIEVKNVSKVYRLYDKPIDRLKEAMHPLKKKYHREFYALNNINFEVNKGEIVGVIGTNGSGKSTLLKIITGVLNQTYGELKVNGKVSALLELGAGFNPEYTGLENIYLNGVMMGYTKSEMDLKIDNIVDFADIGEFIYQPVKTYSSGMFARLAFAVSISVEPDILIVDEVLSVGDFNFQAKSLNKIKDLMKSGTTVLFVSHDIASVKSLCNRVIYLDNGRIISLGDSGEICDLYIKDQNKKNGMYNISKEKDLSNSKEIALHTKVNNVDNSTLINFEKKVKPFRTGSGKVKVRNIVIEDANGNIKYEFSYGDVIYVKVYYSSIIDIDKLVIAMYIKNHNQLELIGTNNVYEKKPIDGITRNYMYCISFRFNNYLKEGEYGISTIIADNLPTKEYYDDLSNSIFFKSFDKQNEKRWAYLGIPIEVENTIIGELR